MAPIVRGSIIGTLLGLMPGMTGSAVVVSLLYRREEDLQISGTVRNRHDRGVVGPETANNAHANGALIPLFTLGIPASPTVAVIMGAFMMHGLIPGPLPLQGPP